MTRALLLQAGNPIFTTTIDEAAFKAKCGELLKGTELWTKVQAGGLKVDLNNPGASLIAIADLVRCIIAAVQVVKMNVVKMEDPDGSKGLIFDNTVALDAAVDMLDEAVTFTGWLGAVVERYDATLLKTLIEVGLAAYRGTAWLPIAMQILGIVA